jgi:hypothetical protein
MKPKRALAYLKNALLIVLSMIVIAGATGLSYQAHYCHNKLSGIAFYTELGIQKSASCGCADDEKDVIPTGNSTVLTKNSCCSSIAFFKKLTLVNTANDLLPIALIQPAVIAVFSDISLPEYSGNENLSSFDFLFRPPPLSGRKLVLFLSQQRIPLISNNC